MKYTIVGVVVLGFLLGCGSKNRMPRKKVGSIVGGETNTVCTVGTSTGTVQAPVFLRNLKEGETSWFASPLVAKLDPSGSPKLIAAYYSLFVYDADGQLLASAADNDSRIYAPHLVTDLDHDGTVEIVVGKGHQVYAYEWIVDSKGKGSLQVKAGWPAGTTTAGEQPEVRGLAAADLDLDGSIEVVATTTQTQPTKDGGSQVFVFNSTGALYQPAGLSFPAWPRYNNLPGTGNDADRNGAGHAGYGCYGLNVGIGNIDEDDELEIIVTYDNHHIQAFHHDGQAIDASSWLTNRQSDYQNQRMTWGQFIRWADPAVEEAHYHRHTGDWPHPSSQEWLQWTASPPNVVDLNGDDRNEILGVPNIEKNEPYQTQAYALMVLEGAYDDGSRSAMRLAGWETLPRGEWPIAVVGWYPPAGVPAAATINIQGDQRPEIVVSLNDGCMYGFDASGQRLWRYEFIHDQSILYASEPVVADLNQDGSPEIIFTTFGDPHDQSCGHLSILAANGALLYDIALPNPGHDGNGNGAPAAPTVADLDGDGQLEILVQTFDHGLDIFRVPGSGTNCLLWTTARGGPLRTGAPSGN